MNSMTGMGRAVGQIQGVPVRIEIKSVNHRFCEVSVRTPGKYLALEILIQQHIKKRLSRGKVDVFINEEKGAQVSPAESDAYKACHAYFQGIQKSLGLAGQITLQDLISGVNAWMHRDVDTDKAWRDFVPVLDAALDDLVSMRTREGANLKAEMKSLLSGVRDTAAKIAAQQDVVREELEKRLREKIQSRAKELAEIDPARLQTEILFYLDRTDIAEELQRLNSHLNQMDSLFAASEPSGRKIDFLLQEFNREFNTIGSKVQNGTIAHLVVDAKSELERLREQIQNIE